MKEAVKKIVASLVGEPDAVEVSETAEGKNVRIEVRVAEHDMGRIIGREGRTIKAIRSILFIAGQKDGRRYHLDLVEDR
ncbi:MAG: KH domain-containing protein [Chloracidobacterium sp.]|nr:KH domain-containing protein [Chloracidobacterium sp.]MCC6826553.1 KH domain-containing protein [Acidobacteriota bacterium]MCO5333390.1 KH domain-containing protein [Pyrinomonadaceae bacterium]